MNPNIHLIAAMAYIEDHRCRLDLEKGFLVGERDYVSNLTTGIRDFWRYRNLPCFAHSQILSTQQEKGFGCDAMIVVKHNDAARVCLFEAKLIRFGKSWDSRQRGAGISHFSDQLQRQSKWTKQAAIWEFFILGQKPGKQPPYFDSWASTCIWHKHTYQFDKTYRDSKSLWVDTELKELVSSSSKPRNLISMLQVSCQDRKGYIPISDGLVKLTSKDGIDERVSIPVTLQTLEDLVEEFCSENGIANFLFLQIDD